MPETKICSKCHRELLVEMFCKDKNRKDGLFPQCNDCRREYTKHNKAKIAERDRKYNTANKEKVAARKKRYYENNKEKILEQHREYHEKYYPEHKEERSQYHKQYYEDHKEKVLERTRKNHRIYYQNNKEKEAERHKKYRENNRDKILEHQRQYYRENREKVIEQKKKSYKLYYANNRDKILEREKQYRKLHPENPIKAKIKQHKRAAMKHQTIATLTNEQWEQIKNYFNNKCCYCGKELQLEQDHFIALSKNGEYAISNIVPACKSCNSSKRDRDFFEWYPKYRYYSRKREKFILEFLGYKDNKQQLSLLL